MATKKDATGVSIDTDAMYVCIESFSGQEDRCARGARLLGGNVLVQGYANFFALASTPDDELHRLRTRLWEESGAGAPA